MQFTRIIEWAGFVIDGAGVFVIVVGASIASFLYIRRSFRQTDTDDSYRRFRQNLGKIILLGLELLVAGDIIRTVAIDPSFASVGVLAIIVVIRTFLSFTLQLEIEGRWPWQKK